MRVSEHYGLGLTQPQLDFVDVDINGDVPVFIDPRALLPFDTDWAKECVELIKDFFREVLAAISSGNVARAQTLLGALREPNETRLGFSAGKPAGHALGPELADRVREALTQSEAVKTGLLTDLEDTVLMIEGVGPDLVSDITTNVIRAPLLEYTRAAAEEHGIPLESSVFVGPTWNPETKPWDTSYVSVPRPDRPLVLVPKAIVRRDLDYKADEYYRDFIIPALREIEIQSGSPLVRVLKDGTPRVTAKDLTEKYGSGKRVIAKLTLRHPELLDKYRQAKNARIHPPLDHEGIAAVTATAPIDWDALLDRVVRIKPGKTSADAYVNAIEALLTPLFYPALAAPHKETKIHSGRKRVDITYDNYAGRGFFDWLRKHYPSAVIFVECKNYKGNPANPDLDQLSARFSPNRGRVGLLVCRNIDDKKLFTERCRDTANDDRGYIIALDDDDLSALVEARKNGDVSADLLELRRHFNELIL